MSDQQKSIPDLFKWENLPIETQAYIYFYPFLVMNELVRRVVLSNEKFQLNKLEHFRTLGGFDFYSLLFPKNEQYSFDTLNLKYFLNNDTLLSFAVVNLKGGPLILEIPDMSSRYHNFQIVDSYFNTIANLKNKKTNNTPDKFILVGPEDRNFFDSKATIIRSTSNWAFITGRILIYSYDDLVVAKSLQDDCKLSPVFSEMKDDISFEKLPSDLTLAAFTRIGEVLRHNPPSNLELKIIERFFSLGLSLEKGFCLDKNDPTISKLMIGRDFGEYILSSLRKSDFSQGWKKVPSPSTINQNYILRAIFVGYGFLISPPEEAMYWTTSKDQLSKHLNGNYSYRIIFDKEKIPSTDAFWSLTLYKSNTCFFENEQGRYSFNNYDKNLNYESDGSLVIKIQSNKSTDPKDNWLPAPKEEFNLMLRIYTFKEIFQYGDYQPPSVVRVESN